MIQTASVQVALYNYDFFPETTAIKSYGTKTSNIALAYLNYSLCNSGTMEASEITHHEKAANPALLQMGFC